MSTVAMIVERDLHEARYRAWCAFERRQPAAAALMNRLVAIEAAADVFDGPAYQLWASIADAALDNSKDRAALRAILVVSERAVQAK